MSIALSLHFDDFKIEAPCPDLSYGLRVRRTRELRGMAQGVLAKLAACSQSTVSDVERGRNTKSIYNADFARALRVDAGWLAFGEAPTRIESLRPVQKTARPKTVEKIVEKIVRVEAPRVPRLSRDVLLSAVLESRFDNIADLESEGENRMPLTEKHGDRVFSMRATNNTNAPAIVSGDVVFIDPDAELLSGDIALVVVPSCDHPSGFTACFRKIEADGHSLFLSVFNSGYSQQLNSINYMVADARDLLLPPSLGSGDSRAPVFVIGKAVERASPLTASF